MRSGAIRLFTLACAVLVVSGCRADGVVDVRADDTIAVDLVMWADAADDHARTDLTYCYGARPLQGGGLTAAPLFDGPKVGCRLSGTIPFHGEVPLMPIAAQHVEGAILVGLGGNRFVALAANSAQDSIEVTVTFPGDVLSSSTGTVSGRTVRFQDLTTIATEGVAISARDRPGPGTEALAIAGAGVAGAALGAAITLLAMRSRRRDRWGGRGAAVVSVAGPGSPPGSDSADEADWASDKASDRDEP